MSGSRQPAERLPGSRRVAPAAALLLVLLVCVTCAQQAAASPVPAGQALVILMHNKGVRGSPSLRARVVRTVNDHRPLTGVRTVLPVIAPERDVHGRIWADVRLPGRPNSGHGWITTAGTMPSWTPWRIWVNVNARRLTVFYRGHVMRRFPVIVGAPSTPTPTGLFFIEEGVKLSPGASGAPYALATSARSDVYRSFDGGPGQTGIHGMANLPGALGTASSHGCVRLDAADITWLAMRIGPGIPLRIFP